MLCRLDVQDLTVLPSPDQLKNKIIVKAKKGSGHAPGAPTPDASQQSDDDEEQEEIEQSAPDVAASQHMQLKV